MVEDLSQPQPHLESIDRIDKNQKHVTFHVTFPEETYLRILALAMTLKLPIDTVLIVGMGQIETETQARISQALAQVAAAGTAAPPEAAVGGGVLGTAYTPESDQPYTPEAEPEPAPEPQPAPATKPKTGRKTRGQKSKSDA